MSGDLTGPLRLVYNSLISHWLGGHWNNLIWCRTGVIDILELEIQNSIFSIK
jgi:hypothetical protein